MAHYINNKQFYAEMTAYIEKVRAHKKEGKDPPRMPNEIAVYFQKIAENLAHTRKFRNYQFLDEMIADAVFYCFNYASNFNPEKSNNPFAYFTQISFHAFVRRIKKEKKYLYVKFKGMQNTELFGRTCDSPDSVLVDIGNNFGYTDESWDKAMEYVQDFEISLKKEKEKND